MDFAVGHADFHTAFSPWGWLHNRHRLFLDCANDCLSNGIRKKLDLGGPAHRIVTKTVHKTLSRDVRGEVFAGGNNKDEERTKQSSEVISHTQTPNLHFP